MESAAANSLAVLGQVAAANVCLLTVADLRLVEPAATNPSAVSADGERAAAVVGPKPVADLHMECTAVMDALYLCFRAEHRTCWGAQNLHNQECCIAPTLVTHRSPLL